jgi:hypothetical protein
MSFACIRALKRCCLVKVQINCLFKAIRFAMFFLYTSHLS